MKLSAHQLNFLPYPGLIAKINYSDQFIYLTKIQFEKKSWQSRNQIKGINNNRILLSVPIKNKDKIQNIEDIQINNETNWGKKHLKSISINYLKSPYYSKYLNFFEQLYSNKWEKIEDLNIYILKYLLKELNIQKKIFSYKQFNFQKKKNELLIEMCQKTNSTTYISNKGSQSYVDVDSFKKNRINHFFINYKNYIYNQNQVTFVSNLTIFDMLFFCGNKITENIIKDNSNLEISKNFSKL